MAEAEESETLRGTLVSRVYDGSAPVDRPRNAATANAATSKAAIRSPFLDDMPAPIRVAPDAPAPDRTSERKPLRPMIGKDPNTFREFQRVFRDWDFRIGTF